MTTLPATFWTKVDKTPTCWNWTGAIQSSGYGSFGIDGRQQSTHRLAYIDAKGAIPDDLHIDHLCMNKQCCNPDHLEAVTQAENNRRARVAAGYCIGGQCGHGHPLTVESTRITGRSRLVCKECEADTRRRGYTKHRSSTALLGQPAAHEIRAWAQLVGIQIGDRGRIPVEVKRAYLAQRTQRNAA